MRQPDAARAALARVSLAAALLVSLAAAAPRPEPLIADYVEASMPALLDRFRVPGAAVALVEDGEVVWTRGFGWADVAKRRPVTDQTRFNIGSISKTLSAWGLMRLVDEGRIGLDEPMLGRLQRWQPAGSGAPIEGVTLRRTLSHTAGFDYCCYFGTPLDAPLPTTVGSLAGADLFWGRGGEAGRSVTVAQVPGVRWSYSGGGYTVAQLLAEEVTGLPFAAYLDRELFTPLGMPHTQANWSGLAPDAAAQPYSDEAPTPIDYRRFAAIAAAGLTTTVSDLARFAAAHLPDRAGAPPGRGVVKPATLATMLSSAPASEGVRHEPESGYEQGYGLGYMVLRLPDGAAVAGHTGSNLGWSAAFWVMPKEGRALVLLTNSRNGDDLAEHWSVATLALWHRLETLHAPE